MTLASLHAALEAQPHHMSAFLVLGDPTPDLSVELAQAAVRAGASMLELGMPYSDPCADGPVIQMACGRAFEAGVSTGIALEILARIHAACPRIPNNLLVYGNLVHARGYRRFCEDAVEAGASSLLVPDIPLEEAGPLLAASSQAGLGHVELVGPMTGSDRLRRLDQVSDAFLYLAAHQGITGGQTDADEERGQLVRRIAGEAAQPVCLGFGLSRPEHLLQAYEAGARIAVVGSHLARVIESKWDRARPDESAVVTAFEQAVLPLARAANQATGPVTGSATED